MLCELWIMYKYNFLCFGHVIHVFKDQDFTMIPVINGNIFPQL